MKKSLKVIGSVFLLGMGLLVGGQLFLHYGLTRTLRKVVLPRVKAETGLDARVGDVSLDVAGGKLELHEVAVKNPPGFLLENMAAFDCVYVSVDWPTLLKNRRLVVTDLRVDHARLNVVRNKAGELNIDALNKQVVPPSQPAPQAPPSKPIERPESPPTAEPSSPTEQKSLPEMVIEQLKLVTTVRYVDLPLDSLEIALQLEIEGGGLSTVPGAETPWGSLHVVGTLLHDTTRFKTDLDVLIAPLTDLQHPSFDLEGTILEIDPALMDSAYDKWGIQMDPFGLTPRVNCRAGRFEASAVRVDVQHIQLEDKLANRLGGMRSIDSLSLRVPVKGSLRRPQVDVRGALLGAVQGNMSTLLDSFWKGAVEQETGAKAPPETMAEAAVEVLADQVDEVGESETTQKVLKELAEGVPSGTNTEVSVDTDALIDILGEQVDEIGENEELKGLLKGFGRSLFGNEAR